MATRGGRDSTRGTNNTRGGGRGAHTESTPRPKKEAILDLSKYEDKSITVKFSGGREVRGTLKGWDQLMNLVLDEGVEMVRDENNNTTTRNLGLLVARGTLLTSISPVDGSEEIANPFLESEEDGGMQMQMGEDGGVVMDGS